MEAKRRVEDVRGFAAAGRIQITKHGRERMNERGVTHRDLRYALENAAACKAEDDERWRVYSTDLSGDRLEAILVFQDGLLVVTVF